MRIYIFFFEKFQEIVSSFIGKKFTASFERNRKEKERKERKRKSNKSKLY